MYEKVVQNMVEDLNYSYFRVVVQVEVKQIVGFCVLQKSARRTSCNVFVLMVCMLLERIVLQTVTTVVCPVMVVIISVVVNRVLLMNVLVRMVLLPPKLIVWSTMLVGVRPVIRVIRKAVTRALDMQDLVQMEI
tara:strand:- start:185 stop:586 length:402 start_codon:yes stop_codon:yes gene_type:complete